MSDVVTLGRRVTEINVSPQFDNYSKVIIHVSDETTYESGNDTGRTLEIDNPFGTQAMADNILQSLTGYQYQPYTADGALLDPAAEIGDAVNARGTYGGIYTRERTFGRLMKADVSAPHDEEINHEYQFESPERREFKRSIDDVKASLIIANDRIDASVSQTGGTTSSFGWSLTSNAHRWYANGNEVMSITASGLTVKGNVQATSGKIGNFNISATAIWNNISSFGGSQSSGVYLGTNGIQLGQGVKMWPTGQAQFTNISANNMTLTGTLNIGGSTITAAALRSGAQSAYSNGSYWSGGAGYGYNYNNATISGTSSYPSNFTCGSLRVTSAIRMGNTLYGGKTLTYVKSISVTRSGSYVTGVTANTETINILG